MENFIISPNFNLHPVTNFKIEEVDKLSGITYNAAGDITAINIAELQQQAGRMVKYNGDIWYCTDLNDDDDYTWYAVTLRQGTDGIYCFKKLDKDNRRIIDVAIIGNLSISQITGLQSALDGKVDKVTGKGLSTNDYTEEERLKVATIDNKVDKETGKGLSTNDYTTAEKTKLAGIEAEAQKNVHSDWNQTDATKDDYIENKPTIPTKTSQLTNDSNFATTTSSAVTVEHPSDLVYTIKQNGVTIGTINIPKDLVVSSKSYLSTDGKTLHLILNDESQTDISIDVSKLIDVYGGSTGTTIDVTVDSNHNIKAEIKNDSITTAHIKDGIITIAKLSNDLQNKINSIATHNHDGDNSERVDYNDLLNLPSISEAVRYVSPQLIGGSGDIAMTTHLCGYSPTVYCVKGTEVIEIYFEINYNTGNVHWEADPEFTTSDDVHIVMVGALESGTPSGDLSRYERYWCGYEITKNESDPRKRVTRIAGEGMMDFYFKYGGGILRSTHFEGVALTEDGKETPIDWNNYDDYKYGQHGDIFLKEKQQLYFYAEETDEKLIKKLSLFKLDGFKPYYPDHLLYIGKYEATSDNNRTKIYSRVIPDSELESYIGGDKSSSYTEKLKGMPATSLNTDKFRTLAKAKGSGYGIQDWTSNNMLFDMFIAEYGTTNSQEDVMSDDSTTGYRRGGLGAGISNVSGWSSFNSMNPVCKCGTTDSLKNGNGEVLMNVDGLTPAGKIYANCFYGIENPFGHIFKLMDGVHIFQNKAEYNKAYYCNNPDKYQGATISDATTDEANQENIGYNFVGNMPVASGYVKDVIWGESGLLLAKNVGAGNKTYFSDYFYQSSSSYSLRFLAVGGFAGNGAHDGFGCVNASNGFSFADRVYGSRLCYYKRIK